MKRSPGLLGQGGTGSRGLRPPKVCVSIDRRMTWDDGLDGKKIHNQEAPSRQDWSQLGNKN